MHGISDTRLAKPAVLRRRNIDRAIRMGDAVGWRNSNRLATVKIVVFAPMPTASDTAAVSAKIGLRRNVRAA